MIINNNNNEITKDSEDLSFIKKRKNQKYINKLAFTIQTSEMSLCIPKKKRM